MTRTMRLMNIKGDSVLAEWDTETASPERLAEIESEYKRLVKAGYFAVDITDKKDEFIHEFNPNADILMIPRIVGG